MQGAYTLGDLEEMKLVALLVDELEVEVAPGLIGIEELRARRDSLKDKLKEIEDKIDKVKSELPYNMKDKIDSKKLVEEYNENTRKLIKEQMEPKKVLTEKFKAIKKVILLEQ